jgi:hypothetical protein
MQDVSAASISRIIAIVKMFRGGRANVTRATLSSTRKRMCWYDSSVIISTMSVV